MLSFGAVATGKNKELGSLYRKVKRLEGAFQNETTMEWWKSQPTAWEEVSKDAKSADQAMKEFLDWVTQFKGKPIFVAHPVGYDYSFISWYLWKFIGKNPFTDERGASITLDIASYISGKYNRSLDSSSRKDLPDWMKRGMPKHSHNALEDAQGFAVILRNILARPQ